MYYNSSHSILATPPSPQRMFVLGEVPAIRGRFRGVAQHVKGGFSGQQVGVLSFEPRGKTFMQISFAAIIGMSPHSGMCSKLALRNITISTQYASMRLRLGTSRLPQALKSPSICAAAGTSLPEKTLPPGYCYRYTRTPGICKKAYPYPGYCAEGVRSPQKFRVLV